MSPPSARLGSLAPSALLSSRWSRDNLVTPDMARLYTGKVTRRIGVEELQTHLGQLSERAGPLEVETGSLGVLSWNVRCTLQGSSALLLVPLAEDEDGVGGRSKGNVPASCFEHARQFHARGLSRYLLAPGELYDLPSAGRAASFSLPRDFGTLTFGLGSACIDLFDEEGAWIVRLGRAATAEVTQELLAALAYHYDDSDGTSISDVLVNDGDFLACRTEDGTFSLRLTCARWLERGIGPERFLLYLIQLMAYEDWNVGDDLVGLPVSISDPSLAFAAFVRGRALRSLDLGQGEQAGEDAARCMLEALGRGRDGRAYLPWIEQFLSGTKAEPSDDPRRPWWNLNELEQRRELLRVRDGEAAAQSLTALLTGLTAALGVGSEESDGAVRINDLDRSAVLAFLHEQGLGTQACATGADAWFAGWPYRNLEGVLRQVPNLQGRAPHLPEVDFAVTPGEEEGTLRTLERLPARRPARKLANPEVYGEFVVDGAAHAELVRQLPSFETFMDDVLHDPRFGYYARRVVIGRGGHFSTHPEDLTPHYGRWLADWAFEVHGRLVEAGQLAADAPFPVIEFGAGNGRLARDIIDATRANGARDASWRNFAARLDYRIYERSESLRAKQIGLLRGDAQVRNGDARSPGACLRRDFPDGLAGFIVSNELPDAFGVHKVVLSPAGGAQAVLVLPRASERLTMGLESSLQAICRGADRSLRALAHFEPLGDVLLDAAAFRLLMASLAELPAGERERSIDELHFHEILVPAGHLQGLAQVLRLGAREYARALSLEASGVVSYVNVHAATFLRELATVLRAGQILTIDYGDTTAGLVEGARQGKFPLRVYCDEGEYEPRPNHPYSRVGGQDITADVNFTDLALAGLDAKLELAYFGPERAVAFSELSRVLASTDQLPFAKFVGNPVFKVLALGRGIDFSPSGAGLEPLPLFASDAPRGTSSAHELSVRTRLEQLGQD